MYRMIPPQIIIQIEELKKKGKYDDALKIVNSRLTKNPMNEEGLYQVADIEYRRGEISKAEKPVDFLLHQNEQDPMGWYIKGVLEMEKTNRVKAKKHFHMSLSLLEDDNPEILRCFGLCEYWSGNREQGLGLLQKAFEVSAEDAEIILNLVEITLLESKYKLASTYVSHYYSLKSTGELRVIDAEQSEYDQRMQIFEEYIKGVQ